MSKCTNTTKVYMVEPEYGEYDHVGDMKILGLFSTMEKAETFISKLKSTHKYENTNLYIAEHVLDSECV